MTYVIVVPGFGITARVRFVFQLKSIFKAMQAGYMGYVYTQTTQNIEHISLD